MNVSACQELKIPANASLSPSPDGLGLVLKIDEKYYYPIIQWMEYSKVLNFTGYIGIDDMNPKGTKEISQGFEFNV